MERIEGRNKGGMCEGSGEKNRKIKVVVRSYCCALETKNERLMERIEGRNKGGM